MRVGGWNTQDLVVVSLGAALIVFFAGVTAAVAAGHTPPTALWAAGSAVSGALIGLLIPPPGAKGRYEARAKAAGADASEAEGRLKLARNAPAAEKESHPSAGTPETEAVAKFTAEIERANAEAAAARSTAAFTPETVWAAAVLGVFFLGLLAVAILLAGGWLKAPKPFPASLKNVITAVVALASASGSALIGLFASSQGKN